MRQQEGQVLLISLVLALVMSMTGINVMNAGLLETRMAGGWRDREFAFQRLELALRHAELNHLSGLSPDEVGPWESELRLPAIAGDLPFPGATHPVRLVISREPGRALPGRGLGISATVNPPEEPRYRIVATTMRNDGRMALSLEAVTGQMVGVTP